MGKTLGALAVTAIMASSALASAQQLYVEYYRSNLFLGLAYHRIGCLPTGARSNRTRTTMAFRARGTAMRDAPRTPFRDGEWFAWNYASGKSQLDACGSQANTRYGTPNYAERSNRCNYNVVTNCNSDCWIRHFSGCQGKRVPIASPCW